MHLKLISRCEQGKVSGCGDVKSNVIIDIVKKEMSQGEYHICHLCMQVGAKGHGQEVASQP